jgi:putative ATP-binding cassette transporter
MLLLGLAVALELGTVYGNFVLADAQRRIYDALQDRAAPAFFAGVGMFAAVMLAFVLVSTYRIFVRQALEIRWRTWLTDHLLEEWISPQACSQMESVHSEADNPDQRIAEDVRSYVASALGLSLSLLAALATLVSFAGLLWGMSAGWQFHVGSAPFEIPGFMMWVAFLYAVFASWITHRVGPAPGSDQLRQAALRSRLPVRTGALSRERRGDRTRRRENVRRESAVARFQRIVGNWWELIRAQRNLTLLHDRDRSAQRACPLLVAAPGYFLGNLTLGRVRRRDRVRAGLGRAVLVRERLPGDRAVARERRAPAHVHRRAGGVANPARRAVA